MATGAELDITMPAPVERTEGLLLNVARPLDTVDAGIDRVAGGVGWLPWPDIAPTHEEAECETIYGKDPRSVPSLVAQRAFLVWDSVQCSAAGVSVETLRRMASLGVVGDGGFVSAQVAAELEVGTEATALDLTGSATVTDSSAVSLRVGLANLETYLATTSGKPGMRGVIHLTPALLGLAQADSLIVEAEGQFHTASGHRVVGDAGHTGQTAPGAESISQGEAWIYATGDIFVRLGAVQGVTDPTDPDGGPVQISRNQHRPLVERVGIIAFDPNTVGAARVTVA